MPPSLEEPITPSNEEVDLSAPLKKAPALVAPEPEHCPGPESNQAGKASSCTGCPNQQICATTPKGPDPDLPLIAARLENVRHKILVLSGKGGVGKSTFSAMLAYGFAGARKRYRTTADGGGWDLDVTPQKRSKRLSSGNEDDEDDDGDNIMDEDPPEDAPQIGLMDVDITGPSIPAMLGTANETIHVSASGWSPVYVADNLGLMSVQYMLPSRDEAVIWRGAKKTGLIKKFLLDVEWGALDYLVVDTPPGTSDEHLAVNSFLAGENGDGVDGAVLVTTPQEVALLDVRKELDFCRKAKIPVLGLVENMSGFVCPKCKHEAQVFKATTGGAESLAKEKGVPFLGRVPLDPRIGMACDYGESFLDAFPDSPACTALREVVGKVVKEIDVNADGKR